MKHHQTLRRGLSVLLSLVLCLSLLPATALAEEGDVAINEETFPDATFRHFSLAFSLKPNDSTT